MLISIGKLGRVRNVEIRQSLKQEVVIEVVRMNQRAWKVKVNGMDGGRLVKRVYSEEVIGRWPGGRPIEEVLDK